MARINLEDQFWIDAMEVAAKMGNTDQAIGNVVRFFRHAQEMHKSDRLVSEQDFKDRGFSDHLFPIFAKRIDGGIIAVGAEKHFGWLRTRVAAAKKGGQSTSEKKKASLKQNRSKIEANKAKSEASPSYSFSSSDSCSTSDSYSSVVEKPPKSASPDVGIAVARFINKWEQKNGAKFSDRIKLASVMRSKVKSEGLDRTLHLIDAYFVIPDPWAAKRAWDVGTFTNNISAIAKFADSGEFISNATIRAHEQGQYHREQMERMERGGL